MKPFQLVIYFSVLYCFFVSLYYESIYFYLLIIIQFLFQSHRTDNSQEGFSLVKIKLWNKEPFSSTQVGVKEFLAKRRELGEC